MRTRTVLLTWLVALTLLNGCAASPTSTATEKSAPKLDVIWVPTPPEVIKVMRRLHA